MFKEIKGRLSGIANRKRIQRRIYEYRHAASVALGGTQDGVREDFADRIVWIFGAGRTGSTWLALMMRDLHSCRMWNEPYIGHMFGHLYYQVGDARHDSVHFVLGGEEKQWMPHVRRFVLGTVETKFPDVAMNENLNLVIKEPHGSVGAPLMMEAVPESRMILLVREPRDAVASRLDARRPGGWSKKRSRYEKAKGNEDAVVRSMCKSFMREMTRAVEAYKKHEGPKSFVTYEELRADPITTMKRICSEVGVKSQSSEIERIVAAHAWENIPKEEKGEGKFQRKAKPGGWKEDLSEAHISIIEEVCGPIMDEFGYRRQMTPN